MKKRMFPLGIAAVALLFVSVSCQQDMPTEYTLNPGTLPAPDNLRAETYQGMTMLRWDVVPNAVSYDIYRKDTRAHNSSTLPTGGVSLFLENVPATQLWFADIVGWDNQLVNEVYYEYTVVSVSNSIGSNSIGVQNGAATVTARANIPTTFTPALADTEVTVTTVTTELGPTLRVSILNRPNLSYTVSYSYGTGSNVFEINTTPVFRNNDWFNSRRIIDIPRIGGQNRIVVTAEFIGGTDFYSTVTQATPTLPTLGTTTIELDPVPFYVNWVTRSGYTIRDARIYWQSIAGTNNNTVYYDFYRLPVDVVNNNVYNVRGDWVRINSTRYYTNDTNGGLYYYIDDITASSGNSYIYMIVAESSNNTSSAIFVRKGENTTTP